MAFARFRFPHFVYFSRLKNACTLVPTVFRWHGKMAFKCHLHFSFSHDIEKQIWILLFVFRFRLTSKNGFELPISFFFFASLWKTDMNFSFRFSFSHHFEKRIWISFFVFALLVIEKQIGVLFVIFAWIWKVDSHTSHLKPRNFFLSRILWLQVVKCSNVPHFPSPSRICKCCGCVFIRGY